MSTQLNPYLHFDGTARAALEFYQSVFGGDLHLMTYGEMGMEGVAASRIMHGALTVRPGLVLMGSDLPPDQELQRGRDWNLSLNGDDADELRAWFTGLSEGGQVHVPLDRQAWGDVFGHLVDRWGVTWTVNIATPTG